MLNDLMHRTSSAFQHKTQIEYSTITLIVRSAASHWTLRMQESLPDRDRGTQASIQNVLRRMIAGEIALSYASQLRVARFLSNCPRTAQHLVHPSLFRVLTLDEFQHVHTLVMRSFRPDGTCGDWTASIPVRVERTRRMRRNAVFGCHSTSRAID